MTNKRRGNEYGVVRKPKGEEERLDMERNPRTGAIGREDDNRRII